MPIDSSTLPSTSSSSESSSSSRRNGLYCGFSSSSSLIRRCGTYASLEVDSFSGDLGEVILRLKFGGLRRSWLVDCDRAGAMGREKFVVRGLSLRPSDVIGLVSPGRDILIAKQTQNDQLKRNRYKRSNNGTDARPGRDVE